MKPMNCRVASFILMSTLLLAPSAHADSFDIRPITIETRDGLGLIVVTNPGERRIYIESQVFDWSQDPAGTELTAEAETAIASPPAMWVAPHTSYTMRLRLPPGQNDVERAYRVIIKQLPERSDIVGGRVVFALTQNLPAFVEPTNPSPPALSGRLLANTRLLVQNSGGRRVRITRLTQDGHVLANGLMGYALAQGAIAIPLMQPAHAGTIEIETDFGQRRIALR